jgi:lauroyl/myristoyl acyltransferase
MASRETPEGWGDSAFNRVWVFRLVEAACRLASRPFAYTVSDGILDWYVGRSPGALAVVRENLRGAFPDLPREAVESLALSTFRNYGRGVVDYVRGSLDPPVVTAAPGAAERLASVAGGKILVTAHMGNWEVGGAFIGREIGRHWIVGFPERDPALDDYRRRRREASGHVSLNAGQGLGTLFSLRKALEAGDSLIVLADRAVGKDAVSVTFRGRRTPFLKSPALLAQLTGRPLLPVAVVAEGVGRYSALVGTPIGPGAGLAPGDLMQGAADFFGGVLERYPDQWYNFFGFWQEAS